MPDARLSVFTARKSPQQGDRSGRLLHQIRYDPRCSMNRGRKAQASASSKPSVCRYPNYEDCSRAARAYLANFLLKNLWKLNIKTSEHAFCVCAGPPQATIDQVHIFAYGEYAIIEHANTAL